ncbi:prepilin peptidase (plasmid) [Coraliomargarita sp. W4R53]
MTSLPPAVLVLALVFFGLFGLIFGSFLNVVIYRLPARVSLTHGSACPHCGTPVKAWQNVPVFSWIALRGRCANCKEPISRRYPLVELATAAAFVAVTWFFLATVTATTPRDVWALAILITAFLYFAAISIALTMIDLDTHRLPNAIVLPSYVVAAILLGAASILTTDWTAMIGAAIGTAVLYAFYFTLRFVRPDGMGGGDVKLAGVIGLYLGWLGWGSFAVGAFAAFLLGGIFGIALLITRRAGRKTAIPFGPWMIAGAWVGIFGGEAIARWYAGLFVAA